MIGEITLAANLLTVVVMLGIVILTVRATRNTRETTRMIERYHADIAWLTARVDELEAKVKANGR